ncbi:MAG: thioredoxin-like domain-containing protein [Saprospiraceae bacterium]|nr:thioredoxin-like domain-containing protein [Saprospiraceae bacterium]
MLSKAFEFLYLVGLFYFCMNCNLNSQSYIIVTERKYDYPLPSGMIVPDIISRPQNIKNLPDSILDTSPSGYQYMEFYPQFLLPNDPYLTAFYCQRNNDYPRSLLFKHLGKNKIAFILDADGDGNFFEEKADTIPVNESALIMREMMLASNGQACPFILPIEIRVDYQKEKFQSMSIRNLLKYQIKFPLSHDTLLVDIRAHQLNMQCYLYLHAEKDSVFRFRLNEPFLFKGHYYKLANLDLCNNTINLVKLEGDKINGYKEGFYLDMVMLRQLTDMHMMKGSVVHWGDKPYTLLHFWGEWCDPCRSETPEVKALDEHLSLGKQVQIVHYPFVFKEELLGRTLNYIRENNLSPLQSFCVSGDCSMDESVREQCNVCTLARVSDFPKYILLNQQGKILFLNKQGGAQATINKLKSLGLY